MTDKSVSSAALEPHPDVISPLLTGGLTVLGLLGAIYASATIPASALPTPAKIFMLAWLALSVICTFAVTPRHFTAGFLCGLLSMLIGWRIAGLHSVTWVTYPLIIAFAAFVLQFFDSMRSDLRRRTNALLGAADWHLTFIRIYVGFDLVPHCTEKLFAGAGSFLDDVKAFAGFGLPWPEAFVIVGGLCELGIAVGIGMGLLTRLAAPCAALYYFIATVIGGHFHNGFIWANPGGGWEYPVLMMVLFLSFAIRGGGRFSLDHVLAGGGWLPAPLLRFAP